MQKIHLLFFNVQEIKNNFFTLMKKHKSNRKISIVTFSNFFKTYIYLFIFIYLFKADSRSITEKKNTTKKQNKLKQQKLQRMIQIQKFKNLFQTFKKI